MAFGVASDPVPAVAGIDTNDHLRLAGAQLADDLRNIVMVGLRWHAVNDLNFTPFSRQQAMNRLGCLQRPDVLVGHQQD